MRVHHPGIQYETECAVSIDQAGADEHWHKERIAPYHETRGDACHCTGLVAALPVKAEEECGSKYGHSLEGLQAHVHQAVEPAHRDTEDVASEHKPPDHEPLDVGNDKGEGPALAVAIKQRGDDGVHDHVADGKALHYYHAACCGETPYEHNIGKALLAPLQGDGKHEEVRRSHVPAKEKSGKRHRKDEYVDQEEVQGEQPRCLAHMVRVVVFHHSHMELPGQEHHRHHGEEQKRCPLGIARGSFSTKREQPLVSCIAHTLKYMHMASKEAVRDIKSYGKKRQELYDGFKGYCKYQSLVLIRGRMRPHAEYHREQADHHGHDPPCVPCVHAALLSAREDEESGYYCLELEAQVGDYAHGGNDRDQDGKGQGVAVTG